MNLTEKNYYGREASQKWMSASQFKAFRKCEAAALAEVRGEYVRPTTTALLVGSYVDAKLEGPKAFDTFISEHPEVFNVKLEEASDTRQRVFDLAPDLLTSTGNWKSGALTKAREQFPECFNRIATLKADFEQAEEIYQRIISDRLMFLLLSGKKQVIVTGEIAGVPFRGKIDSLVDVDLCKVIMKEFPQTAEVLGGPFCTGAIVDGKIMKDFLPVWSDDDGCKVSWIDAWDYPTQGSIYQHLEAGHKPFILAGASKEPGTDLTAQYIPQGELDAALRIVEDNAPRYQAIKEGKIEPVGCGHCEWCRSHKVLTNILNYKEA